MKRSRKISRAEMRRHMKELREMADALGVTMNIYYRPVKFKPYFLCFPCGGYLNGKIVINVYGRPSRRYILHTVAHELRHAIHDKTGLFTDYYRKDVWKLILKKRFLDIKKPLNPKIAFLAERDCNRYADNFLKSKGIAPLNAKYWYIATAAYTLKRKIAELKRNG